MPKIMVVDDEATITTQLEERLALMGYDIAGTAASGEEAVSLARRFRPDLILMDIVMPGKIDGIEAARIIREELDIPVIFLTAYGNDAYLKRAIAAEPLGYIVKPYQESGVKAAIEIALYNRDLSARMKESKIRWDALVEHSRDGIILGDREGRVFLWNQGAVALFGYSSEEALGKPIQEFLSEASRGVFKRTLEKISQSGESASLGENGELIGLRRDWSRFPLELSLIPCRLRKRVFFICLTRDITRRRKTESRMQASLEEKEKSLARIKSQIEANLSQVFKLLNLQTEYGKGEKALSAIKDMKTRKESIDRIHSKLCAEAGPGSIEMADYLENLTTRLLHSYQADPENIRIHLEIEPAFLDLKNVLPCGLLVSELVANALQHAFPGGKRGDIHVSFGVDPKGTARLSVTDNGVGFPPELDHTSTDSLGFQLVNNLVAQLKGDIRLDRKNGTCFRIDFPLEPLPV